MHYSTVHKICVSLACYFISIAPPILANQTKKSIEIRLINCNTNYTNWGQLKLYKNVDYKKLNDAGIPIGLVWNINIKYLEFMFGLSDNSPAQFKYRLLGQDSCWKQCNASNVAKFTNLRNGKYQLEVKASIQGEIISTLVLKFKIDSNISALGLDLTVLFLTFILFLIFFRMK